MPFLKALAENGNFKFIIILLGSFVLAKIFYYLFRIYGKKVASKTKTTVDDEIVDASGRPFSFLIFFIGLFFSIRFLKFYSAYSVEVNQVFFVVFVLLISLIISKLSYVFVNNWLKTHKRFQKTPILVNKALTVIIYLIAILMILGHFNIEITPLIATLGLGGLAVGLALQNTLSNFFAGLHIISDRPINVGDFIEIENHISGYVEDIGWRSTRIRTLPNSIVIVPNSKLAESIIINDSLPEAEMAALVQCGVSYNSDLKKVEKVTVDVAKQVQKTVKGAVKTFEPFIRYHTFADSNINFTVILRVEKYVDKYFLTHEFIKALKDRYDKEKIEISWPVRKIVAAKK